MNFDSTWLDQDSSWWAKANRAGEHLDALLRLVNEYRATGPYSVTPEPTDKPGRLAHVLRYVRPVPPVSIAVTIGDILHNLRAALESLAFELARSSQGGTLTATQARKMTFPISKTPTDFDDRFCATEAGLLLDDRARAALRAVQPFANVEEAHRLGVNSFPNYDEYCRWSVLHRLNELWNIDKHRRLTLTTWWPHLISWGSNGPSNRQAFPGDGTLADGSVLLYTEGHDEGQGDDLDHNFNLVLKDDPAHTGDNQGANDDLVEMLPSWHWYITNYVFPTIFTIMSAQDVPAPGLTAAEEDEV